MRTSVSILILAHLSLLSPAFAGRPVYQNVGLEQMTAESDLIFTGAPADPRSPLLRRVEKKCGEPFAIWQIVSVLKGPKNLQAKPIAIYQHGHRFHNADTAANSKGVSFRAYFYKSELAEKSNSKLKIAFLQKGDDCFEFTANEGTENLAGDFIIRSLIEPKDCRLQKDALRKTIYALPNDCHIDSDCIAKNLNPNSCERLRALSTSAEKKLPPYWPALVGRAKSACAAEWRLNEKCNDKAETSTFCKDQTCTFGLNMPATLPAAKATLTESCAPSDGPSTSVVFKVASEYPIVQINWWSPTRPTRSAGSYALSGPLHTMVEQGFSASYCARQNACLSFKKVRLELHLDETLKGQIDFEGETHDGRRIKLNSDAGYIAKPEKLFCG